eukprot:Nitzschia sp. Nitz4//scaffold163_size50693//13548//15565//NITZ4_006985-RA/size50693-processed-gene-0.34-mRNA-1//-1//CDS//3329538022//9414//frame0
MLVRVFQGFCFAAASHAVIATGFAGRHVDNLPTIPTRAAVSTGKVSAYAATTNAPTPYSEPEVEYEYVSGADYSSANYDEAVYSLSASKGSKTKAPTGTKSPKSAKGKGETKAPKSTKSPSTTKSSKSKAGKGNCNTKSSKSSSDCETPSPSYSYAPTASPVSPSSSVDSPNSVAFALTDYTVLYDLVSPRQASRAELAELTAVTAKYLEDFFNSEFEGSAFTDLDDFITTMLTSTYISGVPYVVDYNSIARFDPLSSVFPSTEQLDESLVIAFTGDNLAEYTSRIASDISSSNVFKGATVYFGDDVTVAGHSSGTSAATIAAAAVASTLLIAGVVLWRRRQEESEEYMGKPFNKSGDATVAGETFAGETYSGETASVGASLDLNAGYKMEEEPFRGHHSLGTIEEGVDREMPTDRPPSVVAPNSFTQNTDIPQSTPSISADDEISVGPSLDEMALQGLAAGASIMNQAVSDDEEDESEDEVSVEPLEQGTGTAKNEVASLLSYDSFDEQSLPTAKDEGASVVSSVSTPRPRTVAEIEALLSADLVDDDESIQDFKVPSDRSASRPTQNRTVAEIEQMLASGMDDLSVSTDLMDLE